MNNKKEYISPTLTVVSFRVEMGFANSNVMHMINEQLLLDDYDQNCTEKWYWDGDNSNNNRFGSDPFEWDP